LGATQPSHRMSRIAIAQIAMQSVYEENVASVAAPHGEVMFRLPRQSSGVVSSILATGGFEWYAQTSPLLSPSE
jgi:hypothetical protein